MMSAEAPTILPLELNAVSLTIGDKRLIKDISCTLEAPQITIIIGPNGAGKSLLLRLCHGLLQPSAGAISWRGAEGRNPSPHQAMVFQRPVLLRRSVQANIDFALALRKVPRRRRRALIEEALGRAGLKRFAKSSARLLSFGEQQRLALARSWALRPQVLFLDEPTASIDPAATHVIEEVILAMREEGTKIIMSTHDLGQARRLADEVLFLHRGRLKEKSDAAAFFAAPKNDLAQAFLRGELLWWQRRELTPP
ncbi:MAG TPA: ATP-binding cassette domain-containing protein [Alphaproteobacteria bacterium]|nr:ATP-binding cassette domain-containing protein [Alphaproteobacteria bacterium]